MYSPFDLGGQGVVITGGNGGIGLGFARALLAAGAKVAIWGSNAAKSERAREHLAGGCGDAARVSAFVCDVGDEAQVDAAFAASVAALGRVDTCFANAGIAGFHTPLDQMSLDEFRRVQRINVEGVFLTLRAAARHMIAHGWVRTEMTDTLFDHPKFADAVLPRIPARRWGTADDFGGIAVYLASSASGYTSGEQFVIDGSYTKF